MFNLESKPKIQIYLYSAEKSKMRRLTPSTDRGDDFVRQLQRMVEVGISLDDKLAGDSGLHFLITERTALSAAKAVAEELKCSYEFVDIRTGSILELDESVLLATKIVGTRELDDFEKKLQPPCLRVGNRIRDFDDGPTLNTTQIKEFYLGKTPVKAPKSKIIDFSLSELEPDDSPIMIINRQHDLHYLIPPDLEKFEAPEGRVKQYPKWQIGERIIFLQTIGWPLDFGPIKNKWGNHYMNIGRTIVVDGLRFRKLFDSVEFNEEVYLDDLMEKVETIDGLDYVRLGSNLYDMTLVRYAFAVLATKRLQVSGNLNKPIKLTNLKNSVLIVPHIE